MKKAFTIVELVVVIAIISVVAIIILPKLGGGLETAEEQIVDIYNGQNIAVIDEDTGDVLYTGERDGFPLEEYVLSKVQYGKTILIYVRKNTFGKEGNYGN